MLKNTIEEQLYLNEFGVSFSYTDTLDAQSRRELLDFMAQWKEEHKPKT